MAGGLAPDPGSASADTASPPKRKVCAGQFDFATRCEVEPRTLGIGAKGRLAKIDWRRWGGAKAVGFGRLTVAGFAGEPGTGIGPTRGRVKLSHLVKCEGKRWYSRITIKYGPDLDRAYVRDAIWFDCRR
ncbi:MAG: hypothetical protein GEU88_01315 [Solirubrobacterales bacterium]|nr:hypothetical protein [Solirubrobacterales bacterium]